VIWRAGYHAAFGESVEHVASFILVSLSNDCVSVCLFCYL